MSKVQGGYILLARKALDSELMDKPPMWSKLWLWMLLKAEWRTNARMPRGTFHTTIEEMREAMTWYTGFRRNTPTKDEIRRAYEWFSGRGHAAHNEDRMKTTMKPTMIAITKITGGMLITILNYDKYQSPENYEAHSEDHSEDHSEGRAKPTMKPTPKKEESLILTKRRRKNEEKGTPPSPPQAVLQPDGPQDQGTQTPAVAGSVPEKKGPDYSKGFLMFWEAYPLKKAKADAYKAWQKIGKRGGVTARQIVDAVQAQVEAKHFTNERGEEFIPHPATWLNRGQWEDEIVDRSGQRRERPRATTEFQKRLQENEDKAKLLLAVKEAEDGQTGSAQAPASQGGHAVPGQEVGCGAGSPGRPLAAIAVGHE